MPTHLNGARQAEVIRCEHTLWLLLNIHLPKGVWGSQIPGQEGGYLRLGEGDTKTGLAGIPAPRTSANCGPPPAKMSQAPSKFWELIHPVVTVAMATASL